MVVDWSIDLAIMLAMILLTVKVLTVEDIFRAAVYFIVFGLFMALAWVRLHAPDIALAEAAVGAGITGVLLLDAASFMRKDGDKPT